MGAEGRRSTGWVVAGVPLLAALGGLAANAASDQQRWPRVLDLVRQNPWLTLGLVTLVCVGFEVALLWPRRVSDTAGLAATEQPTQPPCDQPGPRRMPKRNPLFTGRQQILDDLQRRPTASVVCLHGIGGSGKTSVAIEYSHRFQHRFSVIWWIDAEQPPLVVEQLATLAVDVGAATEGTLAKDAAGKALDWLRSHSGWLVVLDNMPGIELASPAIPDGAGQVLITSRANHWNQLGALIEVDVFTRAESVSLLAAQLSGISPSDADRVADAVGDLPLAVAQAAGFMVATGMGPREYVEAIEAHAMEILGQGRPVGYQLSLAAVVALSVERLKVEDALAVSILDLCALLGSEPIPVTWLSRMPQARQPGAPAKASAVTLRSAVGRLREFGLVRLDSDGGSLVVHRTTAAVVRDLLGPAKRSRQWQLSGDLLAANRPGDPSELALWPAWSTLTAHVEVHLRLPPPDSAEVGSEDYRDVVLDAARYLELSGKGASANGLARAARERWSRSLGDDDLDVLRAARRQSATLPPAHSDALAIEMDTLARLQRLFGPDNAETLLSAANCARALADVGRYEDARQLNQDTLLRLRRVFGDDDPQTLRSADNLANRYSELGEHEAAKALHHETLERRTAVLGHDHPETLITISQLARDLANLGELEEAMTLGRHALTELRRMLGPDHRSTLHAAAILAAILRRHGSLHEAQALDEDTFHRRKRVLGADHPETAALARTLPPGRSSQGEAENTRA
ncbi:tetratricopeptide repeat protein [Micromonospora sp. STR1_7]|uniref:Tetratricopeptide repeat protein n=1 Tax=Micromonospora parastrephiae TaxID=2806101 RepID=A0ABS1XP43_9ACTN|nr:FxSxx-COOH system tetratricopeptide repeat protein [Micromonospora parastrephiae]MBM0231040.1 tetratricopeptide repeat protein [Micromonospora parastrephiae]